MMNMNGIQAPMGGSAVTPPPVAQSDAGAANYQKMLMAQALMGGGHQGNTGSVGGGFSQGMAPALQQMIMQKMLQSQTPLAAPVQAGTPMPQMQSPTFNSMGGAS